VKINQYLKPTFFIDSDAEPVKEKALELTEGVKGEKEKAKRIFYFVRDEIKYNALSPRSCPETFRACPVRLVFRRDSDLPKSGITSCRQIFWS
jgi:hypothetical protein